jgi:cell division protein ZapE
LLPPPRYARARFGTYAPETPSQAAAVAAMEAFVKGVRAHHGGGGLFRRRPPLPGHGLYLVGPAGTGKTHLLAAACHALVPAVPAGFLHASALFRTHETPEAFAAAFARRYRVLCLDEVEVDDPANEIRLVRTLKALDAHGVVVLATSNVEPARFVAATNGSDRFRRFLSEFDRTFRVVVVEGPDYRQRQARTGRAWIGPAEATRAALDAAFAADARPKRRLAWAEFVAASTATEHTRLVAELAAPEALYLTDLTPETTDDALRLLRVLDDLYLRPDAPALHFTAARPPEAWLAEAHGVVGRGIAEKFRRTVSRLRAMCEVVEVTPVAAS